MGKGSSTSTTTNQPPWEYVAGYEQSLQAAQNLAAQPQPMYGGNLVAPLSPNQTQAISNIEGLSGAVAPYLQQAQNYFGQATQPLLNSIPTVDQNTLSGLAPNALALNAASTQNLGLVPRFDTNAIPQYNPNFQFNPNNIPQFSAAALNQYESPYTQQVVQATQAQFANQNAQQQQQLAGNATAAGAWGGDRAAVAQGILAGQQQLAQAPVIANLENQGYTQALGEFNTQQQAQIQAQEQAAALGQQQAAQATGFGIQQQQIGTQLGLQQATAQSQLQQAAAAQQLGLLQGQQQTELGANEANAWLASQAAFGNAQLGSEALNSGLTYNNALMGAGQLQQQQAQQLLNVPYEQFLSQAAYPFQTQGWLANIAEGLGGASGGTSTTSSPGPSGLSQIAGLGTAAVGTLGATGAFGASGWLTGAGAASAGAAGVGAAADAAGTAADLGSLAIAPADVADSAGLFADAASAIATGGRVPRRGPGGLIPTSAPVPASPMVGGMSPVSGASPVAGISAASMASPIASTSPIGLGSPVGDTSVGLASPIGSTAPVSSDVPDVSMDSDVPGLPPRKKGDSAIIKSFKDAGTRTVKTGPKYPGFMSIPAWLGDPGNFAILQGVGGPQTVDDFVSAARVAGSVALAVANKGGRLPHKAAGGLLPHFDDGGDVDGSPFPEPPPPPVEQRLPQAGLAPQSSIATGLGAAPTKSHPDPWLALMAAGFGMMAGRSPHAGVNIGQGALEGIKEYAQEQRDLTRQNEVNALRANTERHQQVSEQQAADRLRQQVMMHADQLKRQTAHDAQMQDYQNQEIGLRRDALDQGHYTWQPGSQTGPDGQSVQGSWRYSTRGDEPPQFFPGVVQTRQDAEQRRSDQGDQRLDIARQGLELRQQAFQRAQSEGERRAIQGMSDQALRLYLGTKDPISGKPTITPEQAEQQAAGFRSAVQPQGTAAQPQQRPAMPPLPKPGDVQQGYRFNGGNPADPKSWVPLAPAAPMAPVAPMSMNMPP